MASFADMTELPCARIMLNTLITSQLTCSATCGVSIMISSLQMKKESRLMRNNLTCLSHVAEKSDF